MNGLEIGCGPQNRWSPGYEGIDLIDFGQKYVGDFVTYKFKEKFDDIRAYHVCEHIPDLTAFFDKVGDVLVDGGTIDIRVPTYPSEFVFQDPTHVHFPTNNFFDYYTSNSPAGHPYAKHHFMITEKMRDRYDWELRVILKKM